MANEHQRRIGSNKSRRENYILNDHTRYTPFLEILGPDAVRLVEIDSINASTTSFLSTREYNRFNKLGARRRKSFVASRMALKQLAQNLGIVSPGESYENIETLAADGIRPTIGNYDNNEYDCSVSHDRRFVIAVAAAALIGVDVEPVSTKALRGHHLFLSETERKRFLDNKLNSLYCATKIWTIKEAVAKALGISLIDAFHLVEVTDLDLPTSIVKIVQDESVVFHHQINGHIFSMFLR